MNFELVETAAIETHFHFFYHIIEGFSSRLIMPSINDIPCCVSDLIKS